MGPDAAQEIVAQPASLQLGWWVATVLAAFLAYRWFEVGLAVLLVGSLLAPLALTTSSATTLNFTIIYGLLLTLVWLLRSGPRAVWVALWKVPLRGLVAFNLVALVSLIIANQPWGGVPRTAPLTAQLGQFTVFALSASVCMMAASCAPRRWLPQLTFLFVALGALSIAPRFDRVVGYYVPSLQQAGADGGMFWTWLTALSFGQALINHRLSPALRIVLAAVAVGAMWVELSQHGDWITGWLPPLIAVGTTLCLAKPRLGIPVAAIVALALAFKASHVGVPMLSGENQYSLKTRLAAWDTLGDIIAGAPFLGLGPANYYHVTPLYPILGWNVKFSAHNNYVDLVAQTGLLGLACFLGFIGELAWMGLRVCKRVGAGFERAYVYGALGGLAGTLAAAMLGDWLLPFVYNVTLLGMRASILAWLWLGGLVALARSADSSVASDAS